MTFGLRKESHGTAVPNAYITIAKVLPLVQSVQIVSGNNVKLIFETLTLFDKDTKNQIICFPITNPFNNYFKFEYWKPWSGQIGPKRLMFYCLWLIINFTEVVSNN